MDAHAGLLGLDRIDVVFSLAALFADGEDAQRSYSFKRVVGFRMIMRMRTEAKSPT